MNINNNINLLFFGMIWSTKTYKLKENNKDLTKQIEQIKNELNKLNEKINKLKNEIKNKVIWKKK